MSFTLGAHSPHCSGIWSTFGWRWRPFSWLAWGPAWCCDTWCSVPARSTGRIPARNRSSSRCRTRRRPFADRSYRSAGPDVPDSRAGIRSQARRCRRRRRLTISTSPDRTRLSASLLREFTIHGQPVNCNRLLRGSDRRRFSFEIASAFGDRCRPREEFRRGTERGHRDDIHNAGHCVTVRVNVDWSVCKAAIAKAARRSDHGELYLLLRVSPQSTLARSLARKTRIDIPYEPEIFIATDGNEDRPR